MGGGALLLQGWKRILYFNMNNGNKFGTESPEEDLMKLLVEKTISVGHMLSFNEASEDPEMVRPNSYAFYFGSFSEAARTAWFRAKSMMGDSLSRLTEQGYKLAKNLGKSHCATKNRTRKEVDLVSGTQNGEHKGKGSRYTIKEVQEALIAFYGRTGKLPTQNDITYDSGLPSWGTLIKFLGPKTNWIDIIKAENADCVDKDQNLPPVANENVSEKSKPDDTSIGTTNTTAQNKPAPNMPTGDSFEEASEGHGRNINVNKNTPAKITEEPSQKNDDIKVETLRKEQDNLVTIDVKITLPNREKPVSITLTV